MNTKLKSQIEEAIQKCLNKASEDDSMWSGYIHDKLAEQMASAAEQVFDSAQDVQEFIRSECGVAIP